MSEFSVPNLRTIVDGPIQPVDSLELPEDRPSIATAKRSGELALKFFSELGNAVKLAPTEQVIAATITTAVIGALLLTN